MRETRSSSLSPSIETEAASMVVSAPSNTGMAWITVMSSSASSPGGASQTIAFAGGRKDLLPAGGFESATAAGLASVAGAALAGFASALTAGLGSAGFASAAADFSSFAVLRLEAGGG